MGGSSLPGSINSFVQSDRVGYMGKANSYYLEDYKKLKKCIKKAGLASVSKVFDSMLRYISLTEYINTPTGSIGECIQIPGKFLSQFVEKCFP
jgi:hypothetical protein